MSKKIRMPVQNLTLRNSLSRIQTSMTQKKSPLDGPGFPQKPIMEEVRSKF